MTLRPSWRLILHGGAGRAAPGLDLPLAFLHRSEMDPVPGQDSPQAST